MSVTQSNIPDLVNLVPYFTEIFGGASFDEKKKEITVNGRSGSIKVNLKQKKASASTGGGVIDTKIQEEGTTVVLNQVIHKNKKFDKKEDILADKETADNLKKLFGKKYENIQELETRFQIFSTNLRNIILHNLDYTQNFTMGINQFTDLTPEEFKEQYVGGLKVQLGSYGCGSFSSSASDAPSSIDWRDKGAVNPVRDQGQCGSCWAFSAVGALESQVMMATGENISLSEQDMVDCVKNVMSPDGTVDCCDGCEGGEMYSVYQYLEKNQNGQDNTEKQYPYTAMDGNCQAVNEPSKGKYRVTGYRALESGDEKQMEEALYEVGPLSVGVNANEDWQLYKGGVYNPTEEQCSSDPDAQDHGVIVVGYGFDGVEFDNIGMLGIPQNKGKGEKLADFAVWLAQTAKSYGLAPIFKNGSNEGGMVIANHPKVRANYPAIIIEEALAWESENDYRNWKGKPVWIFEYDKKCGKGAEKTESWIKDRLSNNPSNIKGYATQVMMDKKGQGHVYLHQK